MERQFTVSAEDQLKVEEWLKNDVYPLEIARQRGHNKNPSRIEIDCWEQGYPYEGAIGGGLTYCFTNTSIGQVCKVKYGSDYELDLTDYGNW